MKIAEHLKKQKPNLYGILYLALIPLYAILYYFHPDFALNSTDKDINFLDYIYFSTVTITTLGYGDYAPANNISQALAASEALFGIIFIGLFLNSLSHQHGISVQEEEKRLQAKKDEAHDIKRLSAFNRIVQIKINRYLNYTKYIVHPRDNKEETSTKEFSFNDMHDLFKPTYNMYDHFFTPAINYFYESHDELIKTLEELVKTGYTQRWPDLEASCLSFIETSKKLDFSNYILKQPHMRFGEKTGSEADEAMIKNFQGKIEFSQTANAVNPYIGLYLLIKASTAFISNYQTILEEILAKK